MAAPATTESNTTVTDPMLNLRFRDDAALKEDVEDEAAAAAVVPVLLPEPAGVIEVGVVVTPKGVVESGVAIVRELDDTPEELDIEEELELIVGAMEKEPLVE